MIEYDEALRAELVRALDQCAELNALQRSKLAEYGALLLSANRRVNLTGAKDVEHVLPHFMDSLAVVPYVRDSLIDIGSGGGLPAIPLGIACGVPCTLIEAVRKKAHFLEQAISFLGLEANVRSGRAEALAFEDGLRERFFTATARAVAVAPTVLEYTMPFLALGGRAILQRGSFDEHERRATADAALMLGGRLVEEVELGGNRRLLIVEKERRTPLRFPRKAGVPAKRPLCMLQPPSSGLGQNT